MVTIFNEWVQHGRTDGSPLHHSIYLSSGRGHVSIPCRPHHTMNVCPSIPHHAQWGVLIITHIAALARIHITHITALARIHITMRNQRRPR